MARGWVGSTRRARLPRNWRPEIVPRIMRRAGGQCERLRRDDGKRCPQPATDVDHIKPGDDHSDTNLAALCTWHHKQKTDLEGGTASAIARKARELADAPKHPGMI